MAAPPSRSDIAGTPTNAQAKTAFGALWDYVTGLLGSTGNQPEAMAAIGARTQAGMAYTTAGTAPSFTVTTSPAYGAYAAGQRMRLTFHAAGAGSDTLDMDGLGAKALMQIDSSGSKVVATIVAGMMTDVEYDGTDFMVLDAVSTASAQIQAIGATVAANALTVTVQPTALDFRDATLSSGTVNTRTLAAAASLVVPSGATLGTANGVLSRLAVLLLDNAGTLEPAIVNLAGGVSLDETGVISTTAISGAANSASVVYSQTARGNLPYRVVGVVESTQATAGTWATAPSLVQGTGGRATDAVGFAGVLTGNGWIKLPGGLILQWGTLPAVTNDGAQSAVLFPVAFPAACLTVLVGGENTSGSAGANMHPQLISAGLSSFTWFAQGSTTTFAACGGRYLALGL